MNDVELKEKRKIVMYSIGLIAGGVALCHGIVSPNILEVFIGTLALSYNGSNLAIQKSYIENIKNIKKR